MSAQQREPGLGSLMIGYVLLGLQPLPVAMLKSADVAPEVVVAARFAIAAVAILLICVIRGTGLKTAQPKVLVLRGLLGGGAVLLYFTAIHEAGAARATLLNYTYPIWANLFAWRLGQKPSRAYWLGLSVALCGLWLVVKPADGWGGGGIGYGELAALGSAVLAGGAVVTIKQLRTTDESLTIIAAFSFFGLMLSAPFVSTTELIPLTGTNALSLALLVGLVAFLGHVYFTRGYRGASVEHATILSLTVPLVAALGGIVLLGEAFSARLLIGGAMILLASCITLGARGTARKQARVETASRTFPAAPPRPAKP